jgi:DNA polymerase III epsilon subunit-like protein
MNNYGKFDTLFAVDCETSGFNRTSNDITENYQSIAWGIIAANAETLEPINKLYLEIKWDGQSIWDPGAERVHGLTKEHLEKQGFTAAEAADKIVEFIYSHIDPEQPLTLLGHNIARFDLPFLRRLLKDHDYDAKFSHRQLDTFSMGFISVKAFNSDDLFSTLGVKRKVPHNALSDAEAALKSARYIRKIFENALC